MMMNLHSLHSTLFDPDSVNIDKIIPMTGTKIHIRFLLFMIFFLKIKLDKSFVKEIKLPPTYML